MVVGSGPSDRQWTRSAPGGGTTLRCSWLLQVSCCCEVCSISTACASDLDLQFSVKLQFHQEDKARIVCHCFASEPVAPSGGVLPEYMSTSESLSSWLGAAAAAGAVSLETTVITLLALLVTSVFRSHDASVRLITSS